MQPASAMLPGDVEWETLCSSSDAGDVDMGCFSIPSLLALEDNTIEVNVAYMSGDVIAKIPISASAKIFRVERKNLELHQAFTWT
eukprot:885991-Karenia_brevis.AAC.1